MKLTRRQLLRGSILGGFAAAGAVGVFRNGDDTDNFQLVESTVAIKNLPAAFEGYRIGFLTDMHLGVYVPTEWVDQSVSMLRRAGVDLLLLGGDFIWLPDRVLKERLYPIRNPTFLREEEDLTVAAQIFSTIADITAQLKPRDGTFAVLGNHDRWTDPRACVEEFRKKEIKVLLNERAVIERAGQELSLIGVDDYWTGVPSIPPLGARAPGQEVRILLAHNPDYISELLRTKLPDLDLSLSGHTHGGQVKLPLMGSIHYNIEDLRFREGFYRDKLLTSYTSRGIGVVEIPFRLNCPPEITLLTLTRT